MCAARVCLRLTHSRPQMDQHTVMNDTYTQREEAAAHSSGREVFRLAKWNNAPRDGAATAGLIKRIVSYVWQRSMVYANRFPIHILYCTLFTPKALYTRLYFQSLHVQPAPCVYMDRFENRTTKRRKRHRNDDVDDDQEKESTLAPSPTNVRGDAPCATDFICTPASIWYRTHRKLQTWICLYVKFMSSSMSDWKRTRRV